MGPNPLKPSSPGTSGVHNRIQKEISGNFFRLRSNGDAFPLLRRNGCFQNEKASSKIQETFGRLSFGTFWRPRFMTIHPRKLLRGFLLNWMDGSFVQTLDENKSPVKPFFNSPFGGDFSDGSGFSETIISWNTPKESQRHPRELNPR
jgi:hypothetical protein